MGKEHCIIFMCAKIGVQGCKLVKTCTNTRATPLVAEGGRAVGLTTFVGWQSLKIAGEP